MALLHDTNYAQKSIDDLTTQLQSWKKVAGDAFAFLNKEVDAKTRQYLDEMWPDLGIILGNTNQLLKTTREELSVITAEILHGIREDHIRRLTTLGNELSETNKALGKVWNTGSLHRTEDGENFWKLHAVYSKIRDHVASLSELTALTKRLGDFVKNETASSKETKEALDITKRNHPKSIQLITESLEPTNVIFLVLDEWYESPFRFSVKGRGGVAYIKKLYDVAYIANAPNKRVKYTESLADSINNGLFRRTGIKRYMRANKLDKPTIVQKAEYDNILVLKGDVPVMVKLIKNIPPQYQSLYVDKTR